MKLKLNFRPQLYFLAFLAFVLSAIFLAKNSQLVYEWKDIISDFQIYGSYRYKGVNTAYMPPLYPYYLLFWQHFAAGKNWVWLSCIFQAIIFFLSVLRAFRIFFDKTVLHSWLAFFTFCAVVFCPPILYGITKVSSFALSISAITLLIVELYSYRGWRSRHIFPLICVLGAGIYVRYEFWLLAIFLAAILFLFRKISLKSFCAVPLLIFVLYSPWCYRNYLKLGKFTTSTSMEYNFAKGNNVNYNIFSSQNLPYDEKIKTTLTDDVLYSAFPNEIQKENYLRTLNQGFIQDHFREFIILNAKKTLINFTQYFPDNRYFNNEYSAYIYSLAMLAVTCFYFSAVFRFYKRRQNFEFLYTSAVYLFFLTVYAVAPLPRYFLLFLPFMMMVILQSYVAKKKASRKECSKILWK